MILTMVSAGNVNFFDEVLISVVQRYPCLWNKKIKEFKDLKVNSNAWKVAEEMDSTGNGKYTVTFLPLQNHIGLGLHCGPK